MVPELDGFFFSSWIDFCMVENISCEDEQDVRVFFFSVNPILREGFHSSRWAAL